MPDSIPKLYRTDTHRTVEPAETLARVRPLLARMGITRVANVTGLDRIGIPVVMVMRPNARSVAVAQGKGLSLAAARASGVMEAVETWHAERVSRPVRYASHADLAQDAEIVDVWRLPRPAGSPFDEAHRLLWIAGDDLVWGRPRWLPFEMVHTDYTHPFAPGHGCFHCSSNGLASGNHLLEATCHAICELIERDATTLWCRLPAERQRETRVRPETVDAPSCREALDRLERADIAVGIWETTSDIGVPAFRCMVAEAEGREGHIGIGDGCHPDHGIALLRALTEAVQTRMTYISGARDDIAPVEFSATALGQKTDHVREMLRHPPTRHLTGPARPAAETFDEDLDWLLTRLAAIGCDQVLTVDLTRPEIGLPVVRAVIPGLEAPHDDDDYVPGPRARRGREAAG